MEFKFLRNILLVLLAGLVAILLQSTSLRIFGPSFVVPNLLVCLVVFLAFYDGRILGAVLSFLLGLELDCSSGILLGPAAGAFVVVYAFITVLSSRIFVESPLSIMIVTFGASVLSSLLIFLVGLEGPANVGPLFWRLILEATISAILAPLLFSLINRCFWRFKPVTARSDTRIFAA